MSTDKSQQAPSCAGKTSRHVSKVSLIIWIVVVLVIGVFLYVRFTDRGQVMMGNIANQGFINWLFGEGDPQADKEIADELRKFDILVIYEQDKGVTSVDFSNCPKPTDDALKQISKLRRLTSANFSNAEINDDQLAYLKKMNHLSNLLINGTPITDAGMVILASMPALQNLQAFNTKITDTGMEEIAKISTLNVLNLSSTGITDQGIKQISHLPNLNWLMIQNTKVTDAGLSELSSLPQLKRLTLSKDMKISDEGVEKIKKAFPKIQVDLNNTEPTP